MENISNISNRLAVVLLACCPVWFFFAVPLLERIPETFRYRAEIVSLDNFYDSEQKQFRGEQRSVSSFSYDVVGKKNGKLLIRNSFNAREITGKEIFRVERIYGIDPANGTHVKGYGDRNRTGYLFAPRHLRPGSPVTYWHVNYDAPAELTFKGEENLFGLKVYHYATDFAGQHIDQSSNLAGLPGVPDQRGVEIVSHLETWFEPVTGRLVKYKDVSTGYFYDRATHERLEPWNSFSNTFTTESVKEEISLAAREKAWAIIIERIIPLLMALVGGSILIGSFMARSAGIIVFSGGAGALVIYLIGACFVSQPINPLVVGIARWDRSASIERNIAGFKKAFEEAGYVENKDVIFIEPPAAGRSGDAFKTIIRSFLDRNVDLIFSLTTPGTLIAKEMTTTTPIVFSVVTYPVETGVIASLFKSGNNLVGTRNWVSTNEQLENFLFIAPKTHTISFVRRSGEPNSVFQLEEFRKAGAKRGLAISDISAVDASGIAQELANRPTTDAIYLSCDTLAQSVEGEQAALVFAQKMKRPLFTCGETGVRNGGLMGTVADFYQIGKLSGEKAVLIFSGATPNSLETDSVLRPTLYVNQKNALELGLDIPQEMGLEATIVTSN